MKKLMQKTLRRRTGRGGRILPFLLVILAVLFCLPGCAGKEPAPEPERGIYAVYYLDRMGTALEPMIYEGLTGSQEELVEALMERFLNVPNHADAVAATGDTVLYEGYAIEDGMLYLNFDEGYGELRTERKTLCNAALTRTFLQIPGLEHLEIRSAGQPLKNADGTPYPMFSQGDFVDSISNVNSYETAELELWFPTEEGKLVKELRTVTYRMDTPIQQLIIEQLKQGPTGRGRMQVLPQDARLLSVSVSESICYLNFSREFLAGVPEVDPELTLRALVNSLTGTQSVQRVQIAVEGAQNVYYKDKISLDTLFENQPVDQEQ